MKLSRFLSVFLLGLGCMLVFVGIAAMLLPDIENAQFQLVLSSFEMPSRNFFVNTMNHAMTFALQNSSLVIGIGISLVFIGIILMLIIRPMQQEAERRSAYQPPRQKTANPQRRETIPSWHPTKAQPPHEENPFATPSVSALLMPRSTANNANAIPAYKPILDRAQAEVLFDPTSVTPYARPANMEQESIAFPDTNDEYIIPRREPVKLEPFTYPVLSHHQVPPTRNVPENAAAAPIEPLPKERSNPVHIRSTFVVKSPETAPVQEQPKADAVKVSVPSSRIKSTMGKHN